MTNTPELPMLSAFSTPAVGDSHWVSSDLLLGAGMVILQPTTDRVLILFDSKKGRWFLPRGRKDLGETLEQAALREAYEETGYRVDFLPLFTGSRAPHSPGATADAHLHPDTEPVYVSTNALAPRRKRRNIVGGTGADHGAEYLGFYYAGQIPEDAVRKEGTGSRSEQHYTAYLLPIPEAIEKLNGPVAEGRIVDYVWRLWQNTVGKLTSKKPLTEDFTKPIEIFPVQKTPRKYSAFSSPSVPDGHFCSHDFILGAGMVVIQPSTQKIALVRHTQLGVWFLPQGRKYVGESFEHAALREAREGTGHDVQFSPLYTGSRAPVPLGTSQQAASQPNVEPIVCIVHSWIPNSLAESVENPDNGGEHIALYYVGEISEHVHQDITVTTQRDGQCNVTYFLSIEDTLAHLRTSPKEPAELRVVEYAWHLWQNREGSTT